MLKVAVVILNWNGEEVLKRFLPSVVRWVSTSEDYQLVIADNGSTDSSIAYINSNFPQIRVIALGKNYGYAGGYNKALSQIEASYYWLLNSDVELKDDAITPIVELMDYNSDIAIVMPKILSQRNPDSFEYAGAAGGYIDKYGFPFCRGRVINSIEHDNGQYNTQAEILWASGAALMIRSSLFKELEGFDSDFFAYMEEIDLCWRARNRGFRVICHPTAKVYHLGAATLGSDSPFKLYLNYRNSLFMLHKNSVNHKRVIFRRQLIDGVLSGVYLLQGKFGYIRSVIRAHQDYRKAKATLDNKRKTISPQRVSEIYNKSIIIKYALGVKLFSKLKWL